MKVMKVMKSMKSKKHLTTQNNESHETNVSAGRLNLRFSCFQGCELVTQFL